MNVASPSVSSAMRSALDASEKFPDRYNLPQRTCLPSTARYPPRSRKLAIPSKFEQAVVGALLLRQRRRHHQRWGGK